MCGMQMTSPVKCRLDGPLLRFADVHSCESQVTVLIQLQEPLTSIAGLETDQVTVVDGTFVTAPVSLSQASSFIV